jgi:hypothetical protein
MYSEALVPCFMHAFGFEVSHPKKGRHVGFRNNSMTRSFLLAPLHLVYSNRVCGAACQSREVFGLMFFRLVSCSIFEIRRTSVQGNKAYDDIDLTLIHHQHPTSVRPVRIIPVLSSNITLLSDCHRGTTCGHLSLLATTFKDTLGVNTKRLGIFRYRLRKNTSSRFEACSTGTVNI